ncbi:hypothetical protein ANCCAN_26565, partial [Ancylostoma caninum]
LIFKRFCARQCEDLRLELLEKEEKLQALQNQVSQLKLALESSHENYNSQIEIMGNDAENLSVHGDSSDDTKQKGDDSCSTTSEYEDASEDFPIQRSSARKFLELTSIHKIRKSQAESKFE